MGSSNSSRATEIQNVNNSIVQESSEKCSATCSNIENGDSTIISGSTIEGNLSAFKQVCQVQASCVLKNQISTQIQDILESVAKQTQRLDESFLSIFSDTHNNESATIEQSITNSVTQILNSSCTATSSNVQSDDIFVLSNSEALSGVIAFSQTGNATSSCTINNISKVKIFNKELAEISQEQRIENVFVAIIALIVAALVIGGFLLFLFFGGSLLFGATELSRESKPAPAPAPAPATTGVVAAPAPPPASQTQEPPADNQPVGDQQPAGDQQPPGEDKKKPEEESSRTTIIGNPLEKFFGGGSKTEDNPELGSKAKAGEDAGESEEAAGGAAEAAGGAAEEVGGAAVATDAVDVGAAALLL